MADPRIPLELALSRRRFLRYAVATGLLATVGGLLPAWAREPAGLGGAGTRRVPGEPIDLFLRWQDLPLAGRRGRAATINGSVPGPLLRLTEGEDVTIRVHNELGEDSSIHWHGILLPFEMDGVPGVSFPGIRAGETFTYRFPVRQSGTYWYHSHSGLQEQLGHYGPLVIDPAEPEPQPYDREHVVVLSDWTFENPYKILARLKKLSDYYNFQQRTVGEFFRDLSADGLLPTVKDRISWGNMRMSPTDIADITGYTYTYLVNGLAPGDNWTGLFQPGERVRLRLINAATMSYFNVRIPGLPMTVVQADGQNVQPVETDELQIAVAETYDVIVQPNEDRAYTLFAEAMDRSGYGRGTLAPRPGMTAPVPELRERPLRTMVDMGMDMGSMEDMDGMEMAAGAEDHAGHAGPVSGMKTGEGAQGCLPGMTPCTGPEVGRHGPDTHGPGKIPRWPGCSATASANPEPVWSGSVTGCWSIPICAAWPTTSTRGRPTAKWSCTSPATWNATCGASTATNSPKSRDPSSSAMASGCGSP